MSDRKYRQRGYQDEPREPRREGKSPEKKEYAPRGQPPTAPKTFNMPGFREVVRCTQCGAVIEEDVGFNSRCPRCGTELHTCSQCGSFDPGSRFECMQPVPARVSPKNTTNACTLYGPRTTVERETTTPRVDDARKAFDDLF